MLYRFLKSLHPVELGPFGAGHRLSRLARAVSNVSTSSLEEAKLCCCLLCDQPSPQRLSTPFGPAAPPAPAVCTAKSTEDC